MEDAFAPRILVVDDEPANVALLERLLDQWGYSDVRSTTDSVEAPRLFADWGPDLLMLDLMMPRMDGFQVMDAIRPSNGSATRAPVLVLTADLTREARQRALSGGASDFVAKPFDFDEVRLRVGNMLENRRLRLELAHQNVLLEQRVRARTRDLERTRLEILDRLALAAEYRDDDTHEHAHRVGRTARLLAEVLGVPEGRARDIGRAARLHDVGKIAIPDSVLLKRGRLTPVEFETIKGHTVIGGRLLGNGSSELLQLAEAIALRHHERWDGSGYPAGLAGEAIPFAARLVALADVFDALTHERPYQVAVTPDDALGEIRRLAGSVFDPRVAQAFEALDHHSLLAPVSEL